MIISRTPYRISFFGGGTDYPGRYMKHGGAVLATVGLGVWLIGPRLAPLLGTVSWWIDTAVAGSSPRARGRRSPAGRSPRRTPCRTGWSRR